MFGATVSTGKFPVSLAHIDIYIDDDKHKDTSN